MYRVIFLGAFYAVVATIVTTLVCALLRMRYTLARQKVEDVRWESDFHELPGCDRVCRHVLTGEFDHRECPHAFDCRDCVTHARLRAVQAGACDGTSPVEEEVCGMQFPLDRYYHRGHAWAKTEPDGTVRVGLDELGRRLVGPPDAVELPPPGTQLKANGAAFHLKKRGAEVRVLSPVDGEVIETGGPGKTWYLRVRPANMNFIHLLRGREIRPWITRELERLQLALTAEGAAPALADGGVPVADIAAACPEADWDAVSGEMFLAP